MQEMICGVLRFRNDVTQSVSHHAVWCFGAQFMSVYNPPNAEVGKGAYFTAAFLSCSACQAVSLECLLVARLLTSLILHPTQPIVLERLPSKIAGGNNGSGAASWVHTKALFKLTPESKDIIRGCTDEMCSTSALLSGMKISDSLGDWVAED